MVTLNVHAQQEGKRKIADNVFVPKGQWIVGTSVSYSEHTEENYQFLVIDKFNSDGYTFKVSPLLVYGIKNNLALGGRFSYGRTLTRFDNVGFSLDDDLTIDLNDTYELTHSYSVMGIMRNYINLGSSKRFALYAETQLKFGGSQSKLVTKEGNELTGTYSTSTDLGIGVSPGIVAFINNYTAVEVSVGAWELTSARPIRSVIDLYRRALFEQSEFSYQYFLNRLGSSLLLVVYERII